MFNSEIKRKLLLQLPEKKYNTKSTYDSIIILNSRKKHDSGYSIMYIVGCIYDKPIEISTGYCDCIKWEFNGLELSTDMLYPSGLVRIFGKNCKLEVDLSVSTTYIKLIKR